jgi:D-alanyl-D-alanine dipeptidase
MKPYQWIPIEECHEDLVPIPAEVFVFQEPHPYVMLQAPYDGKSPYYLRQGVLNQLIVAQTVLQERCPGWKIQIVDAYRPIAVQQFMVDYTFAELVRSQGLTIEQLTAAQSEALWQQVYQFWAVPSLNPATPPPHSTGAAIDITLIDETGCVVDMGGAIDELSPRSFPDYFVSGSDQGNEEQEISDDGPQALRDLFHRNRQLLKAVMTTAGFCQHPNEWWHFSLGDQMWAWLLSHNNSSKPIARYGAIADYCGLLGVAPPQ